ncbi:GGDEF domain-containing protein [Shewanella sp. YIC-542]|uniref:GGDEF domain-containing protein n=1 Tax=Shewanella mytili TaxID=3377111 RepID=UPI00398E999B
MVKTQYKKGLGRTAIVLLITFFSVCISVLITFVIMENFGNGISGVSFANAVIAPLLIAPSVSWYIIGLLVKISCLEEEQRIIATYDTLTHLLNRRPFLDKFERLLRLARKKGQLLSVAYIDIDNFKKINDTHGHVGGDAVLAAFGALIVNNVRKGDLAGRIGGEEFIIVFPDIDVKQSVIILNKIQGLINAQVVATQAGSVAYTISVGVTELNQYNDVSLDELINQSDTALYKAKAAGKNCIVNYFYND